MKITALSSAILDCMPRGEDGAKMTDAIVGAFHETVAACEKAVNDQWVKNPNSPAGDAIRALKLPEIGHAILDHLPRGDDGEKMERAIVENFRATIDACVKAANDQWVKDPRVPASQAIRNLVG